MTHTVDATYENGTLKLDRPLPLKEHEKVRITVENAASAPAAPNGEKTTQASSLAHQTAGMIGWTGDVETLERILKEAEETYYL